jgi:uncharacterized protein (DUF1330 family)
MNRIGRWPRPVSRGSVAVSLSAAGRVELLEGEPQPELIVVIEFPDAGMAHRWYRSEEYQRALKIRSSASRGRLVLVEGRVSGYS